MDGVCATPNVEVIDIDGQPWFVASAVCREMGYQNPSNIIKQHVKPENCRRMSVKTGKRGNTARVLINEVGLYSLMANAARNDKARNFKAWLTEQVLPNYRKKNLPSVQQASRMLATENDLKFQKALTIIRNEVLAVRQEQERSRQERQEVMALLRQVSSYFQLSPLNWREATIKAVREAARKKNTKDFSSLYYEMYSEFERDTGVRLAVRYAHLKKKKPKASILDVIATDKKLVKGFIPVIGAFAMRYGIVLNISNNEKVA